MRLIKKLSVACMILITLIVCVPKASCSGEMIPSGRNDGTTHLPESVSTPEKDIPEETAQAASAKGRRNWFWAVIVVAAIAGVASGSGGGDGGGNDGGGTGSINVSW